MSQVNTGRKNVLVPVSGLVSVLPEPTTRRPVARRLETTAIKFLGSLPRDTEAEFKKAFWRLLRTPCPNAARLVKEIYYVAPSQVQRQDLLAVAKRGCRAVWDAWKSTGYFTFGKHAGKHVSEVSPDYLAYMLSNPKLDQVYVTAIQDQFAKWDADPKTVPFLVRRRKATHAVKTIEDLENWELAWFARTYTGEHLRHFLQLWAVEKGVSWDVQDIPEWDAMDDAYVTYPWESRGEYTEAARGSRDKRTPKPQTWHMGKMPAEYDPRYIEDRDAAERRRVLYFWDKESRCERARAPQYSSRYGELTGETATDSHGNTYRRHKVIDNAPLNQVKAWERMLAAIDKFERADDPDLLEMYRQEAVTHAAFLKEKEEYENFLKLIHEQYDERLNFLEREGKTRDWYVDAPRSSKRLSSCKAPAARFAHYMREVELACNVGELMDVAVLLRNHRSDFSPHELQQLRARWSERREEMRQGPSHQRPQSVLDDEAWDRVKSLLPQRRTKLPLRQVVEAALHRERNGLTWRQLDDHFPHNGIVARWYRKWKASGTWEQLVKLV